MRKALEYGREGIMERWRMQMTFWDYNQVMTEVHFVEQEKTNQKEHKHKS